MTAPLHLTPADARSIPWRNGRGMTRELALWPPDASLERGDFDWRISCASVSEAGPFSALPGVERILVVTTGPGLILSHAEAAPRATLRRLVPYRFSGDWQTTAELCGGPAIDFNVMLSAGRAHAEVKPLELGAHRCREVLTAGHAFVHQLAGASTARLASPQATFELVPGDSLWLRDLSGSEELDLIGHGAGCELLVVQLGADGI